MAAPELVYGSRLSVHGQEKQKTYQDRTGGGCSALYLSSKNGEPTTDNRKPTLTRFGTRHRRRNRMRRSDHHNQSNQ